MAKDDQETGPVGLLDAMDCQNISAACREAGTREPADITDGDPEHGRRIVRELEARGFGIVRLPTP